MGIEVRWHSESFGFFVNNQVFVVIVAGLVTLNVVSSGSCTHGCQEIGVSMEIQFIDREVLLIFRGCSGTFLDIYRHMRIGRHTVTAKIRCQFLLIKREEKSLSVVNYFKGCCVSVVLEVEIPRRLDGCALRQHEALSSGLEQVIILNNLRTCSASQLHLRERIGPSVCTHCALGLFDIKQELPRDHDFRIRKAG
jgi:hypothetical protein